MVNIKILNNMPVSKTDLFTEKELNLAIVGRALSHPARIRIFELLNEHGFVKNSELSATLNLTQTSVSNHIRKLKDADLIHIEYEPNYFRISLKEQGLSSISSFAESFL